MYHRILELYSGIGGMHCAWLDSGLNGEIVAAVDINTIANNVYLYNFPETTILNKNIQSLTIKEIENLHVNTILMSPPCQPFTRNGKQLDEIDPRTDSFLYLINMLDHMVNIEYILMENVKGFESSSVHKLFTSKLQSIKFDYQEFLLCPSSVGVPNSRLRYYCIARRTNTNFNFKKKDEIITSLPKTYDNPYCLGDILQHEVDKTFLISDKLLKRINVMDICYNNSRRSCCFTKAYSHYAQGTGSIYTDASPEDVVNCIKEANMHVAGSEQFISTLNKLRLRFFTPKEVLALMSFPNKYHFPENTTIKQCYRLLGNSVNVKVISELLNLLYN